MSQPSEQRRISTPIPPSAETPPTGADRLHDALVSEGVEVLFGYPGAAIIPLLDRLYESPIRLIVPRHEQGACHMADGYARSTGRVGVVLATSGPGACNLVTGLATAQKDSTPLVAITGQVKSHLIGNDAFQEADMVGITRSVTKHNRLVTRPGDISQALAEAFHIARTGRPGAVLVDVAVDATAEVDHETPREIHLPGYHPETTVSPRQTRRIVQAINQARRPVLYVGGGAVQAGAADALRAVAVKSNVPVTTTLMALGVFDESHPLSLGMLGMHGTPAANYAVQASDCLIAIGARFDDRVTGRVESFAPDATIIHVDVDPASIGMTVQADLPMVADARQALEAMADGVEWIDRPQWHRQIAHWKRKYPMSYYASETRLKPQAVIEAIARKTAHDAIITTGVGQHQMWTAQYFGFRRPRQMITSGGLGTMGFGCPAAIGAQLGNPGKTVIDIDGDGSFTMTMVELITAVENRLPVKFVVLDNGYLGMVRQWQELFYQRRYSGVEHRCPDLVTVAEGFGATGIGCDTPSHLDDAVDALLAADGPAVLVAQVEAEENVFPMVPAGASLHEMTLSPAPLT